MTGAGHGPSRDRLGIERFEPSSLAFARDRGFARRAGLRRFAGRVAHAVAGS